MKKTRAVFVAAVAILFYCFSLSAAMAKDEAVKINNASKVVKEIAAIPKRKIPPVLLNDASAIIVVPKASKRDFMISGASAGGVLLVHNEKGAWSSPVFISISGGSLGWQVVAEPLDIILIFKDRKNLDALMKGKLTINAKIAIESGWLGPNLKGATSKELKAEIASYLLSHGKLVENTTLAGTTIIIDAVANDFYYAKSKVDVSDIVSGKVVKLTDEVKALQKLLSDYAATK